MDTKSISTVSWIVANDVAKYKEDLKELQNLLAVIDINELAEIGSLLYYMRLICLALQAISSEMDADYDELIKIHDWANEQLKGEKTA